MKINLLLGKHDVRIQSLSDFLVCDPSIFHESRLFKAHFNTKVEPARTFGPGGLSVLIKCFTEVF